MSLATPTSSAALPSVEHGNTGWTGAAIAVRSILQIPTPLLLRLAPTGVDPLYIDFRYHAFTWTVPLAQFPPDPAVVDVETEPAPPGSPPLFELPGKNLDTLLWAIGLHAFNGASASWLRGGDRYRLKRWPNFTELPHSIDQMRMTALLGNAFFSVEELAVAAETSVENARRLTNALSLMGVLKDADVEAAAAPVAQIQAESGQESNSLFRRLRNRLGL